MNFGDKHFYEIREYIEWFTNGGTLTKGVRYED